MYGSKSLFDRRIGVTWATLLVLGVVACDNPQPPAACGPLPQVTVNVGERTTVSACFNDPNGDVLTYTATSSNPGVATASISGTSVTVTAVAPGNASVTITAADPEGLQGQQSFQVMVPNRPPQPAGTIPSVSVPVGESTTVDASSYFTEPDGEALTYGATSSNPAVATVSVAGSTVTVTAVAKGTSNVTVTATDPGGLTATQTFQSTVPNRDPEPVGTIPDQTLDLGESVTVDLAPFFEDPDGDALTYAVSSSNTRVARGSVSGSTLTVSTVAPGTATLTVTASDIDGASAMQRFDLTVLQPNRAPRPVGSIPAQTLARGTTGTIDASRYFTDPDEDSLTYTARSSNSGVARPSVSGSRVTITAVATGSATITVTARDPGGLTATQQARVTVRTDSGYQPLSALTITSSGGVRLGGISVGAGCLAVNRININNVTYEIHWTEWQRRTAGSDWAQVPGTRNSGRICGYDLPGAAAGEYRLVGEMSVNGVRGKYRSANTVTVSGGGDAPDLGFTGVSPTSITASPGDTVRATFTIRNSGNTRSAATTVRLLASDNATISTSDRELGTLSLRALAPVEELRINVTLPLASDLPSGTFYLGLCADRVAGESDTSNNCSRSVRVTVTTSGAPDLVFTDVSPRSQTVARGDTVRAKFTLRNNGTVAAAATKVRAFVSDNATISTSDIEIGDGFSIDGIAAMTAEDLSFWWILSSTAPLITVYWGLCVEAVPGESDTTNNCSAGVRLTITASSSSQSSSAVVSAGGIETLIRSVTGSGIALQDVSTNPGDNGARALDGLLAGAVISLGEVRR